MHTTLRSTSTAVLLSLLLSCSVRAQSPAKPPTPPAAAPASAEVVDLGAVLGKTSKLLLPIEVLRYLNRGAAFSLTLLDGRTFHTGETGPSGTLGCGGELKISGNSASGSCVYKFALPSDGCSFPEPSDECPPKTFSFTIAAHASSNRKLVYDVPKACLGSVCASEDDLCVQLTEPPKPGEHFEKYDCTPRAIYPPFQKATREALTAFLADLEKRNMSMMFGNLQLRPDRTFSYNDFNSYACWGKWLQKGLRLNGSCLEGIEPSQMQKTGGDFNLDVEKISDGALIVSGKICTSTSQGCQEKATFRWFRRHGIRDRPGEAMVQLIPGAEDRTLFATVTRSLRTKYEEDFQGSGNTLPLLIEGPPAKKPRVTTEIYFGAEGQVLADALAALLKPVVGAVKPQPWPGQTEYQAIIVVGDRVADQL